jgi:hypothetical protein
VNQTVQFLVLLTMELSRILKYKIILPTLKEMIFVEITQTTIKITKNFTIKYKNVI